MPFEFTGKIALVAVAEDLRDLAYPKLRFRKIAAGHAEFLLTNIGAGGNPVAALEDSYQMPFGNAERFPQTAKRRIFEDMLINVFFDVIRQ